MMNATASPIGALADRTLTPLQKSVDVADFWQMALSLRKAIYNCCLTYMNGNAADAEDQHLVSGLDRPPQGPSGRG